MSEIFINKTIETNQRFQKPGKSKNDFNDVITKVIKICLDEHSLTKVESLKKLLPDLDQVVLKDSPICGYIMYILSDCCRKMGLYEESLKYGSESLQIREVLYGIDSNEVCICLDLLALTSLERGEFENAIKLFIRSFQRKAIGSFTTYSQLVIDINKFALQINERGDGSNQKGDINNTIGGGGGGAVIHVTDLLGQAIDVLVKFIQNNGGINSDATSSSPKLDTERLADLKKAIVTLCTEKGKVHEEQEDYQYSIDCHKIILNNLTQGSKEERLSYESIIQLYVRMNKYEEVKNYIAQFIQMATKYYKVPSVDASSVLWFCAKVMEEQSDKASPTRLCDLVDALRYYICTLKISREVGGVTIGEDSPAVAQKKLREKVETILFNNRPLKPEDVANMVERMLQVTTTEFLLNSSKSQNWLLKYLYPDFIAEDALKEKADTLPTKQGFLSKENGLMKGWKTRWFCLDRDILSYYKYHNDPKPHGEINVLEIKSIEVIPKEKKLKTQLHCFQLLHPKHPLILGAESPEVMNEWVAVLNRAKQYWEDWNSNMQLAL